MSIEHPPEKTGFTNPYGGFWTDLENSRDMLRGKQSLRWLTREEADLIDHWIERGYVIIPNAVPLDVVDAVNGDIEKVLESSPPLCRASFWRDGVKHYEGARKPMMREEEAKLLDLHMVSDGARRAIFSARIHRFITLLFERLPIAFQSLAFELGSQQPTHCDIAFVHVDSPREFVASWIALEDIKAGSGELQYYPGSHRLPDLLFADSSVWAAGDLSDYSSNLDSRATAAGLRLERFTPNKGDALIWSAGLYHGGSVRSDPDVTRKSLVTHYCPTGRSPHPPVTPDQVIETPYRGYVCSGSTPFTTV